MKIKTYINGIKTYISIGKHDNGAEFYGSKDGDKHIVLGREEDWGKFVSNFMHEVAEMTSAYLGFRYYRNRTHTGNDAAYFLMSHEEFSELMAIVGKASSDCLPLLENEWKKIFKKRKGK